MNIQRVHKIVFFCLTVFLFFHSANAVLGQNIPYSIRCSYALDYHPDTNNLKLQRRENMVLLIGIKGSVFKSVVINKGDSTAQFPAQNPQTSTGVVSFGSFTFVDPKFRFSIFKDPDGTIRYRNLIDNDLFEYSINKGDIVWQISQDTVSIIGYLCQKATCSYGGREWIAWFCPAVSVNDGPYVFNNLPGLIIKVTDTSDQYSFMLTKIEQNSGIAYNSQKPVQKLTKQKYYKTLKYFNDNEIEIQLSQGRLNIPGGPDAVNAFKQRRAKNKSINNNNIEILIDRNFEK